jgi:hypothetical protein
MLTIAFISLGLPNPDEAHGHEPGSDEGKRALKPQRAEA